MLDPTDRQKPVVVCALYHFARLDDYTSLRQPLLDVMLSHGVKGTLLLASEGVNGTIAGSRAGIDAVLAHLKADPRLADLDYKESWDDNVPFYRSKVKLKKEIVTMGVEGINPKHKVGTHIEPKDWNTLISDPDVVLIDTRNDYEYQIGTFRNAVNPLTETFREFPVWVQENLDPQKNRKVAMFCTGGIRCEKSTAYLKELGFDEVYHLKGGILKYLEEVKQEESLWQGECFVFDNRVAVDHSLQPGGYDQCHACRLPITEEDKQDSRYEKGVSCHHCHGKHSQQQRNKFRERQHQVELAQARGLEHIGSSASAQADEGREAKLRFKDKQRQANAAQGHLASGLAKRA